MNFSKIDIDDYTMIKNEDIKTKAILIDTCIISVPQIIDYLKEQIEANKLLVIFPSLVIQELRNKKKLKGHRRSNAQKLTDMSLEKGCTILRCPNRAKLEGWDNKNNDSKIIQLALDIKDKYDVTVFTCDKEMAAKAKSYNMNFCYLKTDVPIYEQDIDNTEIKLNEDIFMENVSADNNYFLPLKVQNKFFYYIERDLERPFPHYYLKTKKDEITNEIKGRKIFVNKDDNLYEIYPYKITEYLVKDIMKDDNKALLLQSRVFQKNINFEDIQTYIQTQA